VRFCAHDDAGQSPVGTGLPEAMPVEDPSVLVLCGVLSEVPDVALPVLRVGVGTGVGIASSTDDDQPIQGDARQRATEVALEHVGQGTVIETEVGDGGAAYGVEIRLGDGSVVEVELDQNFEVTGTERDDDSGEV
jgi:hypothetical protein